jgi:hypothetical protein
MTLRRLVLASRSYSWHPPGGRRQRVTLEIGAPARTGKQEWACRFRIAGLPKKLEAAAHGTDAVQALELALVGAGRVLAGTPQFRAGQISLFDAPAENESELFLPLPLQSLQGSLDSLRTYLKRAAKSRQPDSFAIEWKRALLGMMREVSADLATLVARFPSAQPKKARAGLKRKAQSPFAGKR